MHEPAEWASSPRKRAAVSFLEMVVAGQVHEAYATYIAPGMRHHNIYFPGDAASIEQAVADDHRVHPHKRLAVKMVLEEGDRVMVYSHLRMTGEDAGYAMVHIFRFHHDRVVELWDLGQAIPDDSPNQYGMF